MSQPTNLHSSVRIPRWVPWAISATLIASWLFVPPFVWTIGSITLRNTELVRWLPLLIGLIACPRSILRWHWLDIPIVVYCLSPFLSGLVNGIPWQQCGWEAVKEWSYWWIPYALGRFLVLDERGRSALSWCVVIGAVLYIPPTIYEILYGPTLAQWATGNAFGRMLRGAERGTTFKPSVFLSSGFVLTMFYVWAALLLLHRAVRTFWVWFMPPMDWDEAIPQPHHWLWQLVSAGAMMAVVVASKSLGSIVLLGMGAVTTVLSRSKVAVVVLSVLCLLPPAYIGLRTTGIASTDRIDRLVSQVVSKERAGSLRYRLDAEDLVFQNMSGHVWWGYGDWGRWREGRRAMVLDGFWLFTWTRTGMVCVMAWLASVALPILIVVRYALKDGWDVTRSVGLPCALFLALSMLDSMFNYFGEAPVMMCVGVVTAWARELMSDSD